MPPFHLYTLILHGSLVRGGNQCNTLGKARCWAKQEINAEKEIVLPLWKRHLTASTSVQCTDSTERVCRAWEQWLRSHLHHVTVQAWQLPPSPSLIASFTDYRFINQPNTLWIKPKLRFHNTLWVTNFAYGGSVPLSAFFTTRVCIWGLLKSFVWLHPYKTDVETSLTWTWKL